MPTRMLAEKGMLPQPFGSVKLFGPERREFSHIRRKLQVPEASDQMLK